jgi:lipopolysaccharide/colanic/teichoic acid biosynthesis glycosyltransferase
MIRIRGFARKTWRLTKGGSLPASTREVSPEVSEPGHDSARHLNMANNGHNNGNGTNHVTGNGNGHANGNGNGNGTNLVDRNGSTSRTSPSVFHGANHSANGSNGRGNNGDLSRSGVSAYLHKVVEDLLDPHAAIEGRPPLHENGNGAAAIDGQSVPRLETILARATLPVETVAPSPRWKRVFDITCVLLALPIWLPVLVLVMGWIKLVSPGPIFYRQERVGYRRRRFMIFKFRTMHVNAETRSHEEYFAHLMTTDSPMTKLDALDDKRLIRCGRLLRATGLDELPQLFNILKGDMSLVGPRPCLPREFERYSPVQQMRVNALPGLTGYWQVNGKNQTTFSQMIAMDIYYAEHMSLWLDLWIIARTIPALIAQTSEARDQRAAEVTVAPASALNGSIRKV